MFKKALTVLKHNWLIILIITFGAFVRWGRLDVTMPFFYDQARDALKAVAILQGRFVLVGPTTDVPGLFMGPFWFYLLAIANLISKNNPLGVAFLISFFDLATIYFLYVLGKKFFSTKTGLLTATIWAIAPFAISYVTFLSNASTTAFWVCLLVLSLVNLEKSEKYLIFIAGTSGIIFQLNPATAFFIFPFTIVSIFLLKKYIKTWKMVIFSSIIFLGSFFPQILFDIRNQFIGVTGLKSIFIKSGPSQGFSHGLWLRYEVLKDELAGYTFWGQKQLSVLILTLSSLVMLKDRKQGQLIFFLWLLIPIIVYFFLYPRAESHPHYLLSWVPVAVISLAEFITILNRKIKLFAIVLTLFLIYSVTSGLVREFVFREHMAQPQNPNNLSLKEELAVVDAIYKSAQGKPFGYHTYGVLPYWEDAEWRYLLSWYGKNKYGYVPSRREGDPMFLIYEPDPYLPNMQAKWLIDFRDAEKGPMTQVIKIASYTILRFDKTK